MAVLDLTEVWLEITVEDGLDVERAVFYLVTCMATFLNKLDARANVMHVQIVLCKRWEEGNLNFDYSVMKCDQNWDVEVEKRGEGDAYHVFDEMLKWKSTGFLLPWMSPSCDVYSVASGSWFPSNVNTVSIRFGRDGKVEITQFSQQLWLTRFRFPSPESNLTFLPKGYFLSRCAVISNYLLHFSMSICVAILYPPDWLLFRTSGVDLATVHQFYWLVLHIS